MIGNVACLFGFHYIGIAGGILSVLGVISPPLIILAMVTVCYEKARDNIYTARAMAGVRCAVVPIILSVALKLRDGAFPYRICYFLTAAAMILSFAFGISSVLLVLAGVISGLLIGKYAEEGIMNVLFDLFMSFLRIGFSSFGGLSMIPLINSEMISHGWMSAAEVSDIAAIAEMTPGPMRLNCATYAGMRVMGIAGAVSANLGVLMPAFTICAAAAVFLDKFRGAQPLKNIMKGVRPVCIGLILAVVIDLSKTNYMIAGTVSPLCITGGVLSAYCFSEKN